MPIYPNVFEVIVTKGRVNGINFTETMKLWTNVLDTQSESCYIIQSRAHLWCQHNLKNRFSEMCFTLLKTTPVYCAKVTEHYSIKQMPRFVLCFSKTVKSTQSSSDGCTDSIWFFQNLCLKQKPEAWKSPNSVKQLLSVHVESFLKCLWRCRTDFVLSKFLDNISSQNACQNITCSPPRFLQTFKSAV